MLNMTYLRYLNPEIVDLSYEVVDNGRNPEEPSFQVSTNTKMGLDFLVSALILEEKEWKSITIDLTLNLCNRQPPFLESSKIRLKA